MNDTPGCQCPTKVDGYVHPTSSNNIHPLFVSGGTVSLPESTMAPSQTPQAGSRAKIRSSCNLCGTAKVRCDRETPSCGRCLNFNVACVYGPSRKSGRPPRRGISGTRENDTVSVRKRHVTARSQVTPTIGDGADRDALMPQHSLVNHADQTSVRHPVQAQHESVSWMDPYITGPWVDFSMPPFEMMSSHSYMPGMNSPSTWTDSHVNTWKDCSATKGSHICSRESYQILADLICPAPHIHPPEDNNGIVTADLDTVLHCNRKAIARLTPLLQCLCARSVHRVMLHAAIVSRILMWYQQAAAASTSLAPGSTSSTSADDTGNATTCPTTTDSIGKDSTKNLTQTTGFVVINTPPALGTFVIEDPKLQATIRTQAVLAEVEKMSDLIQLFTSHFAAMSSGGARAGVAMLYAHAAAWIKDEYVRLLDDLRGSRTGTSSSAQTETE